MFGGFGTTTPAPTQAFSFSTPQQPAAQSTPFGFGAQQQQQQPQQSQPLTAFGAPKPAATNAPFSFGTPAPTSTPAFGGFGTAPTNASKPFGFTSTTTATTAPSLGTGSLFGQPAAGGSLFGNAATSQPGGTSLFGGGGGFGTTAGVQQPGLLQTSMFGQSQQQVQQQQQQQSPAQQIEEQFVKIQTAWDPNSPRCQFRHYFYNMVHPSEVSRYQCPAGHDPMLFEQAMRDNPDPTCMVPVLATGFGDLQKRIEFQKQQMEIHQNTITTVADNLEELRTKHELESAVKLEERKRRHMELSHRVLQLMKRVQLMRAKGYSINTDDEKLLARLENMQAHLRRPSQFRGRVNELWAQVQMLRDSGRLGNSARGKGRGYAIVDGRQTAKIEKAYEEMQRGENYLIDTIQQDMEDLELMRRGLTENGVSRVH